MIKLLMLILVTAVAVVAARAADVTANATNRFAISGMHCNGCAGGLTAEFKATPGVVAVTVTLTYQLAVVAFDTNRVTTPRLVKVVSEAGYQAKLLER